VQGVLLPADAFPPQRLTSSLTTLERAARQLAAAPGEECIKAALETAVAVLRLHQVALATPVPPPADEQSEKEGRMAQLQEVRGGWGRAWR
jgi:hypothetical protein